MSLETAFREIDSKYTRASRLREVLGIMFFAGCLMFLMGGIVLNLIEPVVSWQQTCSILMIFIGGMFGGALCMMLFTLGEPTQQDIRQYLINVIQGAVEHGRTNP